MNLFSKDIQEFHLPDAELIYCPNFFSKHDADTYLLHFKNHINWQEDNITIFGKTYKQPRLTALYSETKNTYSYSGITMYPEAFSAELLKIKQKIEQFSNTTFNTVLLNLYRHGNDSNGWHADNEKELGKHPIIASLTFGEERPFHFKHKKIKDQRHKLVLQHGSLLIMKGAMQEYWLHQIAKTKKKVGERINLTFRKLI